MMRTAKTVSNPRFARPDNSAVEMLVHFNELDNLGPIKFVADPTDVHEHGKDLFLRAMAGEFGPIEPCDHTAEDMAERVKEHMLLGVDNAAHAAHGIDNSPVYQHRLDEARRFEIDDDPEDFPLLQAMVGHDGATIREVADNVLERDTAQRKRSAEIERKRLSTRKAVMAAPSEAEARRIVRDLTF